VEKCKNAASEKFFFVFISSERKTYFISFYGGDIDEKKKPKV